MNSVIACYLVDVRSMIRTGPLSVGCEGLLMKEYLVQ